MKDVTIIVLCAAVLASIWVTLSMPQRESARVRDLDATVTALRTQVVVLSRPTPTVVRKP